jgi:hypothetical protein
LNREKQRPFYVIVFAEDDDARILNESRKYLLVLSIIDPDHDPPLSDTPLFLHSSATTRAA